jgi:hypothetical protein
VFHIQSSVALENHQQEVSNIQDDFIDSNQIKDALDIAMLAELSRWEGKVYKCLFQRHLSPTDTCAWLAKDTANRTRPLGPHEQISYSAILIMQREFKGMMKEWLRREGHI